MKAVFVATVALGAVGAVFGVLGVLISGWERPPVDTKQVGFRGVGMEQVTNPREEAKLIAQDQLPEPQFPVDPGSEPASEVYQNVQVLGDLGVDEFIRLMAAITEWVSPEQGCAYCHSEDEEFSSDSLHTKVVARRMIEMTRHINANWQTHVGQTGVTCLSCHRGQPVPQNVWFTDHGPPQALGMAADRDGQNLAGAAVGSTSLPFDPFTPFLSNDGTIRVASTQALPAGSDRNIKQTESTYGLMIHMSEALGVNCTFCHNSRSFFDWEQSPPQRVTAWHGIRLARELNNEFLDPLTDVFPDNRLGPLGDVAKINCATCHNGASKPFLGISMLPDYPELRE